ncbi:MAG: phosphotransferase [Patescibacteria group bacterium]
MKEKNTKVINGENFFFIKEREFTSVLIYKGTNNFLRCGPKGILEKECLTQKYLLELGFPVPKIYKEYRENDTFYYIEEMVGRVNFETLFASDSKNASKIKDIHFKQFLNITELFLQAQIKTLRECNKKEKFTKSLLRNDVLKEERPDLHEATIEAVNRALSSLSVFPTALTHGDFHPANIFPKGVIDIESFGYAPLGYDMVTNIYTTYILNSSKKSNNPQRTYSFTTVQIDIYFDMIDRVLTSHALPPLSVYKNDFVLLRLIWAVVRMHQWPGTQKWRYELYERVLDKFLNEDDITKLLV